MLDVEDQIHRYARAAGDSVSAVHAPARPRRPRAADLLAAAAVVAVLGGAILVASRGGGDDVVTVGPVSPDGPGTWSTLPEAPLAARTGEIAIATDDEMIIWGGAGIGDERFADGAAYSFDSGTWRTLAPSPLSPRTKALAVWTGTEVLIWGGSDNDSGGLSGGAAYNPATDSWRELGQPDGERADSEQTLAVWTGRELVLVGVYAWPGDSASTDTVAVDPATGTVRGIDPTPAITETPETAVDVRRAVWSGDEVLLTSATVEGAGLRVDALDVEAGTWDKRLETSIPGLEVTADAVWTGSRVALVGLTTPGVLIDPATGDTTPLDPAGTTNPNQYPTVLLDGGTVSVGDRWLDVASSTWHDTAPIPGPDRYGPVAVTHDGRLYVWGGNICRPDATCDPPLVDPGPGLIWTPPSAEEAALSRSVAN